MPNIIGSQFRKPSGILGRVISALMKKGNFFAYEKLVPMMELKPGHHILEIGYGHGLGVNYICSEYDCKVTGIDFSKLMFKEATKRNQQHINNHKLDLNYGDYLEFEVSDQSFDCIFFINVIYFWKSLEQPLKKIYAELKKGGKLCLYMAHRDELKKLKFTVDDIFNKYTIEQVEETLKTAGFNVIQHSYERGYFIQCVK